MLFRRFAVPFSPFGGVEGLDLPNLNLPDLHGLLFFALLRGVLCARRGDERLLFNLHGKTSLAPFLGKDLLILTWFSKIVNVSVVCRKLRKFGVIQ